MRHRSCSALKLSVFNIAVGTTAEEQGVPGDCPASARYSDMAAAVLAVRRQQDMQSRPMHQDLWGEAHQGTMKFSGRKKSMKPLPSLQVYGKAVESRKKVPFCFKKIGRACSKYMALVAKPSC